MAFKRPRHPSESSSDSPLSPSPSPTPKATRTTVSNGHSVLCNLPPTCNKNPTHIANTKDLEAHYAMYHAHVCEQRGCGCVFPDARFLEMHQTECHDPLAAVRKDRGEKIFACFLASCPKFFAHPKARRLHLIEAHAYPKEYFFAVTNKGVSGLLKKWGEGASMLRGQWRKREEEDGVEDISDDTEEVSNGHESDTTERQSLPTNHTTNHRHAKAKASIPETSRVSHEAGGSDLDDLATSMTSLSLVPGSVRFGRGGASRGFTHAPHHNTNVNLGGFRGGRGGRGRARGFQFSNAGIHATHEVTGENGMDVDRIQGPFRGRGYQRGRGAPIRGRGSSKERGRGRGGI